MTKDEVIKYMLDKEGTTISKPFHIPVPVVKVGSKMFSTINIHEDRPSVNLKYYIEDNDNLRQLYKEIIPGYHMNKAHWNTIYLDGNLSEELIKDLIDVSYDIVYKSLKKSEKEKISERSRD